VKSGALSPGSSALVDRGVTTKIMTVSSVDVALKPTPPPSEIGFPVICKFTFDVDNTIGL